MALRSFKDLPGKRILKVLKQILKENVDRECKWVFPFLVVLGYKLVGWEKSWFGKESEILIGDLLH